MKSRLGAIRVLVTAGLALSLSGCAQNSSSAIAGPSPSTSFATGAISSTMPPATTPAPLLASPMSTAPDASSQTATAEPQAGFPYQVTWVEATPVMTSVRAIEWQPDSLTLHYALGYWYAEPKDWVWWRYRLDSDTREPLPAPVSQVSTATRANLGLCVEPDRRCWNETHLVESPSGSQMAYRPPGSRGEFGSGELWIANVDGTNRRSVHARGTVEWSPQEDFLLVVDGEWPIGHLVSLDDLSVNKLLDWVAVEDCEIWNSAPRFSPDGTRIAFVGGHLVEGNELCSVWEVGVGGNNLKLLSEHVGGLQWSEDSQVLYILERNYSRLSLYRVDTHSASPQTELLAAALPFTSSPTMRWAVSADETRIAYTNACGQGTLCVIRFAPAP